MKKNYEKFCLLFAQQLAITILHPILYIDPIHQPETNIRQITLIEVTQEIDTNLNQGNPQKAVILLSNNVQAVRYTVTKTSQTANQHS